MKAEFGENQGKTRAERGQQGSPGGGRAAAGPGSPCPPAAPVTLPAALLLKPMLCFIFLPFYQINHKTWLQGERGGGTGTDVLQPESGLLLAPAGSGEEPEESKPCHGAGAQLGDRHGGWQAPSKVWGEQPGMGRLGPASQGSPSPSPRCSPSLLARCLRGAVLMGTDRRGTL